MEISYRRDLNHNYMIIWQEGLTGKEYAIRMIEQNRLPELLVLQVRNVDGRSYLYYDITSKQSMQQLFEVRSIGSKEIRQLLEGIDRAFDRVHTYLLQNDEFFLDPEYIYMNSETGSVSFCYVPGLTCDASECVLRLAEFILKRLDHDDREAVFLGYEFYGRVSTGNVGLQRMIKETLAQSIDSKVTDPRPVSQEALQGKDACIQEKDLYREEQTFLEERRPGSRKKKRPVRQIFIWSVIVAGIVAGYGLIVYFGKLDLTQMGGLAFLLMAGGWLLVSLLKGKKQNGNGRRKWIEDEDEEDAFMEALMNETDPEAVYENMLHGKESYEQSAHHYEQHVMQTEAYGETRCLASMDMPGVWRLVSLVPGRYPDIVLDRDRILIGKKKDQVDLQINADAVSRLHAKIQKDGDSYCIADLNSTNGTFINGERLEPHEMRQIKENDKVSFAMIHYRVSRR